MASHSWIRKQEDMECVIQHWFFESMAHVSINISIDDIVSIVIAYWRSVITRMQFSTVYQSSHGWELSDDCRCVTRIATGKDSASDRDDWTKKKWILGDIEPIFEGKTCWRIQLKNPEKGWFSIGVSNRNIESLNASEYATTYVWAIGVNNNWYPGNDYTDCDTKKYFRLEYVELDVLLDLSSTKPELKICEVNSNDKQSLKETILRDIKENTEGWVPYFNMHYSNAIGSQIRVVFIDPDWYSVPIDDSFV
eukprot:22104_1